MKTTAKTQRIDAAIRRLCRRDARLTKLEPELERAFLVREELASLHKAAALVLLRYRKERNLATAMAALDEADEAAGATLARQSPPAVPTTKGAAK